MNEHNQVLPTKESQVAAIVDSFLASVSRPASNR